MANINNTYAQRHYESALDLFDQGQYDKALQQIDMAISKMPTNPDFFSTKGMFLHRMNDMVRAAEAYQAAIRVAPDHSFAHYNLGLIYMKENRPAQAIREWEAVLRTKPNDVESILNIAVALANIGKSKESIPFYEKVLKLSPDHAQAHQNLGVIYRDAGNFEKAKRHLQKLCEVDSTYKEVADREILKCEEQQFLIQLSEDNTKITRELSPVIAETIDTALSALIKNDFAKALEAADDYLEQTPDDVQAMLIKGQALAGLTRNDDAIAVFAAILEIHENADALSHLANAYFAAGNYAKALELFERLKKLDSSYTFVDENIVALKARLAKEKHE